MPLPFELAAGTIVGRHHVGSGNLLVGKPNQDAFGFRAGQSCIVATVHDGCSKAQYAELGARAAAEIVPQCILHYAESEGLPSSGDPEMVARSWERVRQRILARLCQLAQTLSGKVVVRDPEYILAVRQYLQFTTLGVLITPSETTVFSVGDGFWAVNGCLEKIPPYPDNAPPYLCYDIIPGFEDRREMFRFNLRQVLPTADLQSVLIATDGLGELIDKQESKLPGKSRLVGPVNELWEGDHFVSDFYDAENGRLIETLTPFLRSVNSEVVKLERADGGARVLKREPGLIQDDITMVALRRRKE